MRPSFDLAKESLRTKTKSSKPVVFQTWQRSGSCPEGTVPIRRIRRRDLLRATSLEHFGRKTSQVFSASNSTDQKESRFVNANNTKIELLSIVNRTVSLVKLWYLFQCWRWFDYTITLMVPFSRLDSFLANALRVFSQILKHHLQHVCLVTKFLLLDYWNPMPCSLQLFICQCLIILF